MSCEKHKKEVAGISDMKKLAELIGDLHYETLSNLLIELHIKLYRDSKNDHDKQREKLADALLDASDAISIVASNIYKAWEISKPYMETQSTNQ